MFYPLPLFRFLGRIAFIPISLKEFLCATEPSSPSFALGMLALAALGIIIAVRRR